MMNTINNNEQAITALTQAITALTQAITADATTTEATATTAETTTTTEATPVIVLDDDDSVAAVGFKGSMIEQDPMDPMPSAKTAEDVAQKITDETAAEETVDEANAVADTAEAEETVTADTEEMIDKIICDISTLYDVAEFALCHEGKNIDSDHSPYAPTDNRRGLIGDYQVFISKEITKDGDHIEGSFRLVVKDKVIVNPIMDLEIRLIDDHYKIFSSENTRRIEQMKEDHNLMRFLEITDEVSALVMSKYISK